MREEKIKEWFTAWFDSEWNRFDEIFNENAYYSESWGPEYTGICELKQWFKNWHEHSELLTWDITTFIHNDRCTIVEWYFSCKESEETNCFNGVSIIEWDDKEKIRSLKEYASSLPKYDPLTSSL